jgi:hypothetical protein
MKESMFRYLALLHKSLKLQKTLEKALHGGHRFHNTSRNTPFGYSVYRVSTALPICHWYLILAG